MSEDYEVPAKRSSAGSSDTARLIVHTSRTKRSSDFIAHLEQLDRLYGPIPERTVKPVVLVEDNGPIHVSKITLAALAARQHWLTVEWLADLHALDPQLSAAASTSESCASATSSSARRKPEGSIRGNGA